MWIQENLEVDFYMTKWSFSSQFNGASAAHEFLSFLFLLSTKLQLIGTGEWALPSLQEEQLQCNRFFRAAFLPGVSMFHLLFKSKQVRFFESCLGTMLVDPFGDTSDKYWYERHCCRHIQAACLFGHKPHTLENLNTRISRSEKSSNSQEWRSWRVAQNWSNWTSDFTIIQKRVCTPPPNRHFKNYKHENCKSNLKSCSTIYSLICFFSVRNSLKRNPSKPSLQGVQLPNRMNFQVQLRRSWRCLEVDAMWVELQK